MPDEFFRQPCSCGGLNENCYRCGGWGYVDQIGEGLGEGVHAFRESLPVTCPICHCQIKKSDFRRHLNIYHGERDVASAKSSSPHPVTTCPVCRCTIRTSKLDRHLRRIHGETGAKQKSTAAPLLAAVPSPAILPPTYRSSSPAPTSERLLDGTQGYSLAYRENGRFGSHADFDRYDDESGA